MNKRSLSQWLMIALFTLFAGFPALAQNNCGSVHLAAPAKFSYSEFYRAKLRETSELNSSAPVAATLRLLIMATTYKREKILIPLDKLAFIHPIDRGAAMEKAQTRIDGLKGLRDTLEDHDLSDGVLNKYIPSKNSMRAVETEDGHYVVFDGNGRLFALKSAFEGEPIRVQVEVFRSNSTLMQRVLKKLRAMRGVLEDVQAN